MAELPTGTVTFLFTDLESSTRLWDEQPDEMRAALARHDAILVDAVESRGGQVVKGTGDGRHAVFATADSAVAAAVAAQQALAVEPWGSIGPLRVRMGLHSGSAELRGGDYYGPALNRAARLMAAAHGGQVVVSRATADLVRDAPSSSVGLMDLGEHRLRDLSRPERVFQLTGPGMERDFPPLRVGHTVGNVVVPSTSFVGRDIELAEVSALVVHSPLVTLLGVGGVGKTRLAQQVAHEVAAQFANGVWFCDLAAVSDADGVALAIATSLGVVPPAGLPVLDAVLEFLQNKELLVVLDNCEHLVDGIAAFAQAAMATCPSVRLLATSREALALEGERLWPVRPLRVPEAGTDVERATATAPVRLFVDRVQMLRPEFSIDPSNVGPVVEICRHLDGIPLALELAAARARSLSPAEIAERLDRRFALLTGSRRRTVSRHETLRAAIDWSYDLLDEPERALLARVSVFSGGFTLDAAESVCEPLDEQEPWEVLGRLVDKSLLTVEEAHGWSRYRLLETIRQYAFEHLDATGMTAELRDRHLAYFVDFAERAARGLRGIDEEAWDLRLALETENLRSAMGWAIETRDLDRALRITNAFSRQTFGIGRARLLAGLVELLLDVDRADEHPLYPVAMAVAAEFARADGDYDRAVELAERAIRRSTAADSARRVAEYALGNVAMYTAHEDPTVHFEHAMNAARAGGDPFDIAQAQTSVALGLSFQGAENLVRARAEAEAAAEIAVTTQCPGLIGAAYFALGYTLVLAGDPEAGEWLRRSLTATGATNSYRSSTGSMLALHLLRYGTPDEALEVLEEAIVTANYRTDHSLISTNLDLAIPVFVRCGDLVTAAELRGAIEHGALPRVRRGGVAQDRRASTFAALDARLSPEELAAADARGIAMSYDQVVNHALERVRALRERLAADPVKTRSP